MKQPANWGRVGLDLRLQHQVDPARRPEDIPNYNVYGTPWSEPNRKVCGLPLTVQSLDWTTYISIPLIP